jgi:transposase-like protein
MTNLKEKALELHRNGKSYAEIASALGISKTSAFTWVKDADKTTIPNDHSTNVQHERTFGTPNSAFNTHFSDSRSELTPNTKVKVKEPGYVLDHQQRIAELEARTAELSAQLLETKQKQIDQLKRKFQKIQELVIDNNGEVWSVDELFETASKLENLMGDILDLDPNTKDWVNASVIPLIQLLEEAAESLTDENLDEGEVCFYED